MDTGLYIERQKIHKFSLSKDSKPILKMLDIVLTERCNNNCMHCYINLPAGDVFAKKKELLTDEIKGILKESVSLGCMRLKFTGGEPLLREDFEELYIYARKLGLTVLIFTNATLITPQLADLFVRIPPLEKIEISVYGMKKSSYEAVTRIPGSFEKAWKGINLLEDKKIPFIVRQTLLPSNKSEMDEFESWAAAIPWMDKAPNCAMFFDFSFRRDVKRNKFIKKIRVTPAEGLAVLTRRPQEYIKAMKLFCAKFNGVPGDRLFFCGAGIGRGCVDAYGYFQPCLLLRHPDTVYDLKNGSLKDALINFFPKLRKTKATNPEYLARCARCFLKCLCEQCPARSWLEHGILDAPVEYFCEIAHAQARFLGLLNKDEMSWETKDWRENMKMFVEENNGLFNNRC